MSLLDLLDSKDPAVAQGLLQAGLSLLQSRGSLAPAIGRAGQAGSIGAQAWRNQQLWQQQESLQNQLRQGQLQEQQRQLDRQAKLQALAQQFLRTPQQQAMAQNGGPTLAAANATANTAPGFDYQGYAGALAGIDPMAALDLQGKLRKEVPKLSKLEVMRGADGSPINVAVFEDGTSKVLPYGVKPEIALQNLGNRVVSIDKNAANNGQSWKLGVSPDAQLSANTTMRGQNMTDARAREGTLATLSKPFEVTGPDGNPVLVQQDKVGGGIKPVEGYGPKAGSSKPLTDSQAKSLLFGTRAQESSKIMDQMSAKGVDRPSLVKQAAEGIPLIGGVAGAAANFVASDSQQSVEQAQRDFVNAVLRRESGAVISQSEFENARKQYFPQIGDSAAVKEQKKRNRDLAINGILAEVPEGKRASITPASRSVNWSDLK